MRSLCRALVAAVLILAALTLPASAQTFVGPANGGGWSGTIRGTDLIYNGVTYPITNSRVYFPDCTNYLVAPNGALFAAATTPELTPGGGCGLIMPTVTWSPATVTVGTALSGAQLNAMASYGGNPLAGTFVYEPPAGTVIVRATGGGGLNGPGYITVGATFTPTDGAHYWSVRVAQEVYVTERVGGSFVGPANGGGYQGTMSGTNFIYNGQSFPVTDGRVFFPDCTNYLVAGNGALFAGAATPNCTVGPPKVTPVITWAVPAAITQGTALGGTQLNATASSDGASVPGTFAYSPAAGTILPPGSQTLNTTFVPSDSTKYTTATATVMLVVTSPQLVLQSATVDVSLTTLTITGEFSGISPVITVNGTTLAVISKTNTQLTTTLPLLKAGTYRVRVNDAQDPTISDTFDLTIGRTGPMAVYDANNSEVGSLIGPGAVVFCDEHACYQATVSSTGWAKETADWYYLDAACSNGPFLFIAGGGGSPSEMPANTSLFNVLHISGGVGYYDSGRYFLNSVPLGQNWYRRRGGLTSPCETTMLSAIWAWFAEVSSIQLPDHPGPFSVWR